MIDKSFLFVQNFILQIVFLFRTTTRGHIPHLRKQFKSIYTYDYIIMLIKRRKTPLSSFWELNSSSFEQTWISSTQGCFKPNLVEIGPVVLVLEKKTFKFRQFQYFVIISPQKRQGHSFEQAWIPFIRGCSVQNLFEIGLVQFWRRRFFKFCQFVIISPWKRAGPSFELTWIFFTQGCFVPSLVEIGPVVLEKKMKMWKFYDNAKGGNDSIGKIVIRRAHLSLQLRWAKKLWAIHKDM